LVDELVRDILEFKHLTNLGAKEVYRTILVNVIEGVYGMRLNQLGNPILHRIGEKSRRICEIAVEMLRQGLYGPWICEALREAVDVVKLQPNRKHVIICDALAIHDALLLAYNLEGRVKPLFAVNSGGKTKTFEYMLTQCPLLRERVGSVYKEPTLTLIAKLVAQLIAASSEKYDDFDTCVHSTLALTKDFEALTTLLYTTFEKLLSKVKLYLNMGFAVFMLADHGYDIDPNSFTLCHRWDPKATLSLSILAPLLVIR
jgi:hypothetical protein